MMHVDVYNGTVDACRCLSGTVCMSRMRSWIWCVCMLIRLVLGVVMGVVVMVRVGRARGGCWL